MKNLSVRFALAALPLLGLCASSLYASSSLSAQTAIAKPATKTAATHVAAKPGARKPASAGPTLPKNIPAVPGVAKSLYALRYIEIKAGTGETAMPGWVYSVHYTGWLYDGTKFDSSLDRGTPIEFIQGQHRVIIGWDTGFEGMKVGGKRRLFIPWQLAYGEQGRSPIPPQANLIFDIELVDQRDPSAPLPVRAPPPPSSKPGTEPAPPNPPASAPETKAPPPVDSTHDSTTQPKPKPE